MSGRAFLVALFFGFLGFAASFWVGWWGAYYAGGLLAAADGNA